MWKYTDLTREEFEIRKDYVEEVLIYLGAVPIDVIIPHKVSCFGSEVSDSIISARTIYEYKKQYFRVCEVLFPRKPFIVLEWTDNLKQVINNEMEDILTFPFDCTNNEIIKEVEKILR